jgi:hypothetical protein
MGCPPNSASVSLGDIQPAQIGADRVRFGQKMEYAGLKLPLGDAQKQASRLRSPTATCPPGVMAGLGPATHDVPAPEYRKVLMKR